MLQRTRRISRFAKLSFVLACACAMATLSVACDTVTAPLPTGAVEWSPPARFALWWQMTESCSGRQGDLRAIRWYIVPNATSIDVDGERVQGVTFGTDRIVLADAHRLNGPLVRHEMLHALLRVGGHPREAFLVGCDGVVACVGKCEMEAGGRQVPPASAREISPSDVATHIEFAPRQPAASRDEGAVAVIVSITNPLDTPAWVRLTPRTPGDPFFQTFGIAFDDDDTGAVFSRSYQSTVEARFPLGPRETRRWVWDDDLPAGDYGVRGWFNSDSAQRLVVKIAP